MIVTVIVIYVHYVIWRGECDRIGISRFDEISSRSNLVSTDEREDGLGVQKSTNDSPLLGRAL